MTPCGWARRVLAGNTWSRKVTCSCSWLGSNTSDPWPFLRASYEIQAGAIEPGEDCAPCPLPAGASCATGLYTDLAAGDNGVCVPCPPPTGRILSSVALALGGVGLLLALWKMSGRESHTMATSSMPTDAEVYSGKQKDIAPVALALKQPLLKELGCDEERVRIDADELSRGAQVTVRGEDAELRGKNGAVQSIADGLCMVLLDN